MLLETSTICRYCGGVIRLVSAETVYGASVERLGKQNEKIYQCQNCGARVGCHKGTDRPLGNVANGGARAGAGVRPTAGWPGKWACP